MRARDFTQVCDTQLDRVFGFFAYALSSRADAEDLTQQTFERALGAWGRYDAARASAATWLLAIARNLLIDHLRAARADRTQTAGEVELQDFAAPPDRHRLGLDPELERALDQLSQREREVITLRFGGDLRSGEIAELTGLTTANVHQILSRSLRRMRAGMESLPVGAAS